jgi:hypothetical protein
VLGRDKLGVRNKEAIGDAEDCGQQQGDAGIMSEIIRISQRISLRPLLERLTMKISFHIEKYSAAIEKVGHILHEECFCKHQAGRLNDQNSYGLFGGFRSFSTLFRSQCIALEVTM